MKKSISINWNDMENYVHGKKKVFVKVGTLSDYQYKPITVVKLQILNSNYGAYLTYGKKGGIYIKIPSIMEAW